MQTILAVRLLHVPSHVRHAPCVLLSTHPRSECSSIEGEYAAQQHPGMPSGMRQSVHIAPGGEKAHIHT